MSSIDSLKDFATRLRDWIQNPHKSEALPFDSLAKELFNLQFHANTPYRRVCEALGVKVSAIPDWQKIPAVPTTAFKDFEMTCLPAEQRVAVFHSSGTTGQQVSRHFHSRDSLAVYEASLWPGFAKYVLAGLEAPDSAEVFFLTPSAAQAPCSSLVHMFDAVGQKLKTGPDQFFGQVSAHGAWSLELDPLIDELQKAGQGTKPVLLLGTAFSTLELLDGLTARDLRIQLPPGSRAMETGGYKGRVRQVPKAELHRLLNERLGIARQAIVCEYGMSELSSQAYDESVVITTPASPARVVRRKFHFPAWARSVVISPETGREVKDGETGLLRIFDLANVYSVMAVQTEDLAVRRGDGFELLGRAPKAEARGCSLMNETFAPVLVPMEQES